MLRLTRELVARYERQRRRTWLLPFLFVMFAHVSMFAGILIVAIPFVVAGIEPYMPLPMIGAALGGMSFMLLLHRLYRRWTDCPACCAPSRRRVLFTRLPTHCHQCLHPLTVAAFDAELSRVREMSGGPPLPALQKIAVRASNQSLIKFRKGVVLGRVAIALMVVMDVALLVGCQHAHHVYGLWAGWAVLMFAVPGIILTLATFVYCLFRFFCPHCGGAGFFLGAPNPARVADECPHCRCSLLPEAVSEQRAGVPYGRKLD